jgi:hypothetical protein
MIPTLIRSFGDYFKLSAINMVSWISTIASLELAVKWLQACSLLMSFVVSCLSAVYIVRKIRKLDKK